MRLLASLVLLAFATGVAAKPMPTTESAYVAAGGARGDTVDGCAFARAPIEADLVFRSWGPFESVLLSYVLTSTCGAGTDTCTGWKEDDGIFRGTCGAGSFELAPRGGFDLNPHYGLVLSGSGFPVGLEATAHLGAFGSRL